MRASGGHVLRTALIVLSIAGLSAACSDDDSGTVNGATPTRVEQQVAAKPSVGCELGPAAAVQPGEEKVTLPFEGTDRWFYRHVPTGYTPTRPVPVILDFHGLGSGADVRRHQVLLGPFGDANGFATITPNGLGERPAWSTGLDSADLRVVGKLLDEVERTLCVDENRIFVTGFSNGAGMTSAIACAYADRIAAVAPVAGIHDVEGCRPARAVPVVTLHGTADASFRYNGSGRTSGEVGRPDAPEVPSVPDITAAWAKRNGCVDDFTESRVADDVTLIEFRCPRHAETRLYRIADGGHAWPGSEFSQRFERQVGHTTFSISANEVMWNFFVNHPLRHE
jgi:polyhydroxybutyrate depolymerase